MTKCQYNCWFG